MNSIERDEIRNLPEKYRPLGAWAYFGYSLLFSIPLVGFICLIVFSFNNSNINRRSYARSFFCGYVIVAVLIGIVLLIAGANLAALLTMK